MEAEADPAHGLQLTDRQEEARVEVFNAKNLRVQNRFGRCRSSRAFNANSHLIPPNLKARRPGRLLVPAASQQCC